MKFLYLLLGLLISFNVMANISYSKIELENTLERAFEIGCLITKSNTNCSYYAKLYIGAFKND